MLSVAEHEVVHHAQGEDVDFTRLAAFVEDLLGVPATSTGWSALGAEGVGRLFVLEPTTEAEIGELELPEGNDEREKRRGD